ncbi:MAG TPA: cupin domain-containing protein [Anaerolineales bacterium]|nr:cupin [Anaerolineaceae bacterium]HJO91413.1 cupin domain-containing protein [Anaerolineales bacterium]
MTNFLDYRDLVGTDPDRVFKSNLFQSDKILVGLNCLTPGQTQDTHTHAEQDKFYYVIQGCGEFVVGNDVQQADSGCTIWAAAGVEHGVTNTSDQLLVLLVVIAPAPQKKS